MSSIIKIAPGVVLGAFLLMGGCVPGPCLHFGTPGIADSLEEQKNTVVVDSSDTRNDPARLTRSGVQWQGPH